LCAWVSAGLRHGDLATPSVEGGGDLRGLDAIGQAQRARKVPSHRATDEAATFALVLFADELVVAERDVEVIFRNARQLRRNG
jgi:hypothetical protein